MRHFHVRAVLAVSLLIVAVALGEGLRDSAEARGKASAPSKVRVTDGLDLDLGLAGPSSRLGPEVGPTEGGEDLANGFAAPDADQDLVWGAAASERPYGLTEEDWRRAEQGSDQARPPRDDLSPPSGDDAVPGPGESLKLPTRLPDWAARARWISERQRIEAGAIQLPGRSVSAQAGPHTAMGSVRPADPSPVVREPEERQPSQPDPSGRSDDGGFVQFADRARMDEGNEIVDAALSRVYARLGGDADSPAGAAEGAGGASQSDEAREPDALPEPHVASEWVFSHDACTDDELNLASETSGFGGSFGPVGLTQTPWTSEPVAYSPVSGSIPPAYGAAASGGVSYAPAPLPAGGGHRSGGSVRYAAGGPAHSVRSGGSYGADITRAWGPSGGIAPISAADDVTRVDLSRTDVELQLDKTSPLDPQLYLNRLAGLPPAQQRMGLEILRAALALSTTSWDRYVEAMSKKVAAASGLDGAGETGPTESKDRVSPAPPVDDDSGAGPQRFRASELLLWDGGRWITGERPGALCVEGGLELDEGMVFGFRYDGLGCDRIDVDGELSLPEQLVIEVEADSWPGRGTLFTFERLSGGDRFDNWVVRGIPGASVQVEGRSLVLTPEPMTLLVLALGGGLLCGRRRRAAR